MNKNLAVVLARPKYPRNIGMIARCMDNFGYSQLILIQPQCELDLAAQQGATHSQNVLNNAKVYPSWQSFYENEPEGLRIAFSKRVGKNRPSEDFQQTLKINTDFKSLLANKNTYLVYGPEDHGLNEQDLELIHRVFHFQLSGQHTSMNLSHAVVHTLTALSLLTESTPNSHSSEITAKPSAANESFYFPDQSLKKWLSALKVDITTHPKVNAHTVLKRMILRSVPTEKELRILEGILEQSTRKIAPEHSKK